MSRHRSGKRPWLAAALAFVYPGLGHVYLRKWLRALVWFLLVFVTTALALPESALPESGSLSIDAVFAASRALPLEASVALLVLSILNIVDAYRIARQRTPTRDAATAGGGVTAGGTENITDDVGETTTEVPDRCPHCGRETDTDLDFCQWCGEPLDADP